MAAYAYDHYFSNSVTNQAYLSVLKGRLSSARLRILWLMANKDFLHQRICVFLGESIDLENEQEIAELLRNKFDIRLPQRRTLNESLASTISDHEIISLLQEYRALS